MKPKSITMTPVEAQMAAGCIRNYFLAQLGDGVDGRLHRLYGEKLVKEMGRRPRKGAPLVATLRDAEQARRLKQLVGLYGRIYRRATPMDVEIHPKTGKPCSYDQWKEAITMWALD